MLLRRWGRSIRAARRDGESGAAAVEFALVLPVLLLILFGIVDYGIYFSDSLAGQSGVREATRQAVTVDFDPCATPLTDVLLPHADGLTPTSDMQDIACMVDSRTQAITGQVYVDVVLPPAADGVPTWTMGQPLLVCETLITSGLTGFVPLPGGGAVRSKAVMTIEDPTTTMPEVGGEQALPGNENWNWCTL
jgi:TadE-like protein